MTQKFGIIILVGGRSSRFGQDKGLYVWRGKPLVVYMLEELVPLRYPICLAAFDEVQVETYQRIVPKGIKNIHYLTHALAPAHPPDIRAPILGAAAGLRYYTQKVDATFILSCDIPFIKAEILQYLADHYAGEDAVLPQWDSTKYLEPLHGLYTVEVTRMRAEDAIAQKNWKLLQLIQGSTNWKSISIEKELKPIDPSLDSFANFNYVEDLEKFSTRKSD